MDIEEGFSADIPLVFFFGHTSPGENPTLFKVRDGVRKQTAPVARVLPVVLTSEFTCTLAGGGEGGVMRVTNKQKGTPTPTP